MGTNYTGPGKLSIGRRTSSAREPFFVLTFEDVKSGQEVSVSVEAAAFAHALGNAHGQPCEIEWNDLSIIGKTHERKTEMVPCAWNASDGQKAAALAPFEVDGWQADSSGEMDNHHRYRGGKYRVDFHRWVEDKEPK